VPRSPVAAVTVCVLSPAMTLPKTSSSCNTGSAGKTTPAVARFDGCRTITSWLAAAGLIANGLLVAEAPSELSVAWRV
jgi:hypothetical protein